MRRREKQEKEKKNKWEYTRAEGLKCGSLPGLLSHNSSSQVALRSTQIFLRCAAENFWRAATRWTKPLRGGLKMYIWNMRIYLSSISALFRFSASMQAHGLLSLIFSVTGFYHYQGRGGLKTPYYITSAREEPCFYRFWRLRSTEFFLKRRRTSRRLCFGGVSERILNV